jgi:c-di-AMP phosphodiesterase-like protein
MPGKYFWKFRPVVIAMSCVLVALALLSLLWNVKIFICEMSAVLLVLVIAFIRFKQLQIDVHSLIKRMSHTLSPSDKEALSIFPLPVVIAKRNNEILWYNGKFRESVLSKKDVIGLSIKDIAPSLDLTAFENTSGKTNITAFNRKYSVYGSVDRDGLYILYWIDDTELKNTAQEYQESRPCVCVILIDNYDDLLQNAKEGEKSVIIGAVEKVIMEWVSKTTGFLRRSDRDKYFFVIEERHLRKIIENRFDILDNVREIVSGDRMPATLSIGVGRGGSSFAECEEMSRQALDMALGRGGDQAAIKSRGGFEFYGGTLKAVEKRTKVKTRIIASALAELIEGSDNVLIMGHKNSDLDVVGASAALYKAIGSRGKEAKIVLNRKSSLAQVLISKLETQGYQQAFIEPEDAGSFILRKTLLIVIDTHRPNMVEYPDLLKIIKTIVVIDHHRKMVDFIDNAVIFHHEPFASSTCEMVSELIQYVADNVVTSVEANAMLAGITLDTRNFTVRTGVRTFEAAAYLRRKGADTATVRLFFSGSIEGFNKRSKIVTDAETYRGCAISIYKGEYDENMRIIAPQAADELLTINGISASFVIFSTTESISISARSMGKLNVQLVMEQLGGGGHQTMAGAQLSDMTLEQVRQKTIEAIDKYFDDNR